MARVIFVRHGIRGFPAPPPPTQPLDPQPLLLSDKSGLNLYGHLHSYQLGQWIGRIYGTPDFIYGDVSCSRTVDTAINIGLGSGVKKIFLSTDKCDSYFNPPIAVDATATKDLLRRKEAEIQKAKVVLEKVPETGKLQSDSSCSSSGEVSGLQSQVFALTAISFLCEYSNIKSPYLRYRDAVAPMITLNWDLLYPTSETVDSAATSFLDGVCTLLRQHNLSVLVGHEHNAITLSKYFDAPYKVPGFPELWVPPNSGFIFTLKGKVVEVELLYLSPDGRFHTGRYGSFRYREGSVKFSLISRVINY